MYLSGEGVIKLNFVSGLSRYYVSGGGGFFFVLSKSSSIVNLDTSNATNQIILLGAGGDIGLSKKTFIPFSLEYGLFPGSASVKASMMFVRAGYGWRY